MSMNNHIDSTYAVLDIRIETERSNEIDKMKESHKTK